ncbi:MAG: DUF2062 domain-containing protein [Gammaproteobacteria bacterium]|nr:DUF2062 domain-containing protein [Gammaproteobacteria bacterium]
MMRRWRDNRLVRLVIQLLGQGVTPRRIALTVALGVVLGVTPVLGSTTALCALAAVALQLNLPLIQLVNYLVYPLQFVLLVPFVQAGQWLFREPPLPLSLTQIIGMLRAGVWRSLAALWDYVLHGLAAWLLLGSLAVLLIYILLLPVLTRLLPADATQVASRISGGS